MATSKKISEFDQASAPMSKYDQLPIISPDFGNLNDQGQPTPHNWAIPVTSIYSVTALYELSSAFSSPPDSQQTWNIVGIVTSEDAFWNPAGYFEFTSEGMYEVVITGAIDSVDSYGMTGVWPVGNCQIEVRVDRDTTESVPRTAGTSVSRVVSRYSDAVTATKPTSINEVFYFNNSYDSGTNNRFVPYFIVKNNSSAGQYKTKIAVAIKRIGFSVHGLAAY